MTPKDKVIAFSLGFLIGIGLLLIVYILKKIIAFKGEAVKLPDYNTKNNSY